MLTKSEALEALEEGKTLEGSRTSSYPGEEVEYLPRVDEVNGNPDFYPWRVVGRKSGRLPTPQVVVKE